MTKLLLFDFGVKLLRGSIALGTRDVIIAYPKSWTRRFKWPSDLFKFAIVLELPLSSFHWMFNLCTFLNNFAFPLNFNRQFYYLRNLSAKLAIYFYCRRTGTQESLSDSHIPTCFDRGRHSSNNLNFLSLCAALASAAFSRNLNTGKYLSLFLSGVFGPATQVTLKVTD